MTSSMRNHTLAAVFSLLFCSTALLPAYGQQPPETATITQDWQEHTIIPIAISPDGTLEAHAGTYDMGFDIKTLSTGQNVEILKTAHHDNTPLEFAFSPDGTRLAFVAAHGTTQYYPHSLYIADINGSDLTLLLDPSANPDPAAYFALGPPTFSPDGTRIMIGLSTSKQSRDADGKITREEDHSYIGLVSVKREKQRPDLLPGTEDGDPLFWSKDGTAIYYQKLTSGDGKVKNNTVFKFNLATRQSEAIRIVDLTKIGRVPGEDALFVQDQDRPVSIVPLDGSSPTAEQTKAAAAIPDKDNQGWYLERISSVNDHQMLLTYDYYGKEHFQLVGWPE